MSKRKDVEVSTPEIGVDELDDKTVDMVDSIEIESPVLSEIEPLCEQQLNCDDIVETQSRQRIAIFTRNWMESTLLAHGLPNRCLKSWKKAQVVFSHDDVERLISLDAPIRIFVEE